MAKSTRDDTWKLCIGPWDRLTWARERKFRYASEAAEAFGEKEGTYRAYERAPDSSKHTPLDHQKAMAWARRLGVRWEWLLEGKGEPWRSSDEYVDRVMAAFEQVDPARRGEITELIEGVCRTAWPHRNAK